VKRFKTRRVFFFFFFVAVFLGGAKLRGTRNVRGKEKLVKREIVL